MKRDIGLDNQARALESTKVSYVVAKFHELWSTNGLEPNAISTHPHSFVLSQNKFCFTKLQVSSHRTPSMRH